MGSPRTIAELYKMFETMKADFDRRLKIVEDSNKSLTLTVKEKEKEILELKQVNDTQAKAIEKQSEIQKVVDNHQNFLEKTDSFRRECNVVIYGLTESTEATDDVQVNELLLAMECPNTALEKCVRLGKPPEPTTNQPPDEAPRPPRPRPLLVVCKARQDTKNILTKTKKLAAIEKFKKVFVKKDQTPYERKEWTRLREVLKREKGRPENAGMNVKIDYRTKSVMVGDRVVEKGNFRRGPEW